LNRRGLLVGLAAPLSSCVFPLEGDRWRLVYVGNEYALRTINTAGREELFANWGWAQFRGPLDRRTLIVGTSVDGSELWLSRTSFSLATGMWVEGDNGLLRYPLRGGERSWVDCPILQSRHLVQGIPGIALVLVVSFTNPHLRKNPTLDVLVKAVETVDGLEWWVWSGTPGQWDLFAERMDVWHGAEYPEVPPRISRPSPTGRPREVVYSREGTIYGHDLGGDPPRILGQGEFPSVCPQAGLISWRTAAGDLQIAEFPSLRPVRTLPGPFRDGVLWCPNGKWGVVARDTTWLHLGDIAMDQLALLHVEGLRLTMGWSYRRHIGTSALCWIDCAGRGKERLRGLEAVVLAPRGA
jgi:hypothetical protein